MTKKFRHDFIHKEQPFFKKIKNCSILSSEKIGQEKRKNVYLEVYNLISENKVTTSCFFPV